MLRVVETFSGIGSQAKALKNLGVEFEILNTVEWDISAFYAYDIIHNGAQDLSAYENYSKAELLEILNGYSLSTDGKEPANQNFLRTWPEDALRRVLCALNRTNNLGRRRFQPRPRGFGCPSSFLDHAFHRGQAHGALHERLHG